MYIKCIYIYIYVCVYVCIYNGFFVLQYGLDSSPSIYDQGFVYHHSTEQCLTENCLDCVESWENRSIREQESRDGWIDQDGWESRIGARLDHEINPADCTPVETVSENPLKVMRN